MAVLKICFFENTMKELKNFSLAASNDWTKSLLTRIKGPSTFHITVEAQLKPLQYCA